MSTTRPGNGLDALADSAVGPDSRIGALARRLAALVTQRAQHCRSALWELILAAQGT